MRIQVPQQRVVEQDRLDEIQGDAAVEREKAASQTAAVDPALLIKLLGAPNASSTAQSTASATAPEGLLAVRAAHEKVAAGGLDRAELLDELQAAAVHELTPAAQTQLIRYLESKKPSPETLTWVAAKIRESLPPDDQNRVGPLRRYLNSKGIKLFSNDRLAEGHPGYHLDREGFRAELLAIEKAGGVIDKKGARKLLAGLKSVVDEKDLLWAQWQVRRRLYEGSIRFAGTDASKGVIDPYESSLHQMLSEKLGGKVNTTEIGFVIRDARNKGFDEASMSRVHELLERCSGDPDALFYAERTFRREMQEAKNATTREMRKTTRTVSYLRAELETTKDPQAAAALRDRIGALEAKLDGLAVNAQATGASLDRIAAKLDAMLAPKLEGQLDRWSMRKQVIDRYRSGEIGRAEVGGLMSAVAMSRTMDDFAYATMTLHQQLAIAEGWEELQKAWDEMLEAFRQALSGDTYDSNGNLIETSQERHLRQALAERQIEQLQSASDRTREIAERAQLRSLNKTVRTSIARARSAGEVADLKSAQASIEAQQNDVGRARIPG